MTREEAKNAFLNTYQDDDFIKNTTAIFDDIFDDFENRTCSNCEWNMYSDGGAECSIYITAWSEQGYSHAEFGCNKWEKKDAL